jgi:hypothetical protein
MKKSFLYTLASLAIVGLMFTGCASRGKGKVAPVPVNKSASANPAPQAATPATAKPAAPPKTPAMVAPAGNSVGTTTTVVSPPFAPPATNSCPTILVGEPQDGGNSVLFINQYGKPVSVLLNHGRDGKFELLDKGLQRVEVNRLNPTLLYLITTPDGVISKSVNFSDGPDHEVLVVPKGAGKP